MMMMSEEKILDKRQEQLHVCVSIDTSVQYLVCSVSDVIDSISSG